MAQVPRGLYGESYDGALDPQKITTEERAHRSVDALVEERQRRSSPSPLIRRLQAATDKAFGRKGK